MRHVLSSIPNNKNLNAEADLGCKEKEEIVNALVEQGLPRVFNPNNYIQKIAENYGISLQEARGCLKEAIAELENANKEEEQPKKEEKLYAQSGYFYPSKDTNENPQKDGMDSLVAFATFQRLKFGL